MRNSLKQSEFLSVISEIYQITVGAQKSKKLSSREKKLLAGHRDVALGAASAISLLISSNIKNKSEADLLFSAIISLSRTNFDIGMITHMTESAIKYADGKRGERRRAGKIEKRAERTLIMDKEFGKLIDRGFGGERLQKAIIKEFEKNNIPEELAQPSLQRVKKWATNFRKYNDWRDPPKPSA